MDNVFVGKNRAQNTTPEEQGYSGSVTTHVNLSVNVGAPPHPQVNILANSYT